MGPLREAGSRACNGYQPLTWWNEVCSIQVPSSAGGRKGHGTMTPSRTLPRSLAVLSLVAVAGLAPVEAQSPQPFQPKEYQPGKDVVWVPTAETLVQKMLDMAKVTASDYVI